MEKQQFCQRLNRMTQTLDEIETLKAWLDLEKSERRETCVSPFRISTRTDEELRVRVGEFSKEHLDLLAALNKHPKSETLQVRNQLQETHVRFQQLQLAIGL